MRPQATVYQAVWPHGVLLHFLALSDISDWCLGISHAGLHGLAVATGALSTMFGTSFLRIGDALWSNDRSWRLSA